MAMNHMSDWYDEEYELMLGAYFNDDGADVHFNDTSDLDQLPFVNWVEN